MGLTRLGELRARGTTGSVWRGALLGIAVALLVSACMGEGTEAGSEPGTTIRSAAGGSTGPTAPTAARVLPPSDFVATPAGLEVVLTWTPSPGEVDRYLVYQDERQVGSVSGSEATFTIEGGLVPAKTYVFGIEAQGEAGSSDRISASVELPSPGLAAARLEGIFHVTGRTVSSSGFKSYRKKPKLGWYFKPHCPTGPCDVRWNDLDLPKARTTLTRRGTRYRGTYSGVYSGTCAGARTTATVTLTLRVTAARVVRGKWRATRLRGTLEQSSPAQLGCVSSRATVAVRARVVDLG